METIKKYFPYCIKAIGGFFIIAGFGMLVQDFPSSLLAGLFFGVFGFLVVFPFLFQDQIQEEKTKVPAYIGVLIALFLGGTFSLGLIPERPSLQLLKTENLVWNEELKRYDTTEENITLIFDPLHTENAKGFYIDGKEIDASTIRIEHPVQLSEQENIVQTTVEDEKGRKTTNSISIFYTSPSMIAQAEQKEAEQMAQIEQAKAEAKLQRDAEQEEQNAREHKAIEEYTSQQPLGVSYSQMMNYLSNTFTYMGEKTPYKNLPVYEGTYGGGKLTLIGNKENLMEAKISIPYNETDSVLSAATMIRFLLNAVPGYTEEYFMNWVEEILDDVIATGGGTDTRYFGNKKVIISIQKISGILKMNVNVLPK